MCITFASGMYATAFFVTVSRMSTAVMVMAKDIRRMRRSVGNGGLATEVSYAEVFSCWCFAAPRPCELFD